MPGEDRERRGETWGKIGKGVVIGKKSVVESITLAHERKIFLKEVEVAARYVGDSNS